VLKIKISKLVFNKNLLQRYDIKQGASIRIFTYFLQDVSKYIYVENFNTI